MLQCQRGPSSAGVRLGQTLRYPDSRLNELQQVNTRVDACGFEHVHQILRGDVSFGPRRIGTSTQTTYAAVEHAHAAVVRFPYVSDGLAVGIVEVASHFVERDVVVD